MTGKVGVWSFMSADAELGLLYLPTNTPAPDYYGGHRLGDNLFAESVVALDIETGQREWHFQAVHHGLWDWDFPAAPNLVDVVVDGRPVKALAQVSKQGFLYAFNRETGEPIWPIEERAVATDTDVPGERPSPTQPFPTKPAPFEYQGAVIDDLADFTPEIREMAIDAVQGYRLGPIFSPPMWDGTLQRPSAGGGANWSGAAVDPETGILYVPSNNAYSVMQYREQEPGEGATLDVIERRGPTRTRPQMPQGLPLFKPPYSRMTAIDLNTGDHVWMKPMGNGDRIRNHRLLRDLDLPPLGGDSSRAGPLLTPDILIYALTAGGTNDSPRLVALDKGDGRGTRADRSAGRCHRHADDLPAERAAVPRTDGRRRPGAGADRVRVTGVAGGGKAMAGSETKGVGRRDFLKEAAAGAAGMAGGAKAAGAAESAPGQHDHDHDHQVVPDDIALRVRALESILVEKEMIDPADLDAVVDAYENRIGPRNGAQIVARAWTDPEYRARLLADGTAAIEEFGFTGAQGEHMVVVENTPAVHNLVVCTLCSCYPWPTLGLPPVWYKSAPYRARAVIEPRAVLREFGVELPDDVEVRVWDSTAEIRYLVLPARPAGTEGLSEEALTEIVTRDSMIGVAKVAAP